VAKRLGGGETTTAERVIVALLLVASFLFVAYGLVEGQANEQERLEQEQ